MCFGNQVDTERTRERRYIATEPHFYLGVLLAIHTMHSAEDAAILMGRIKRGIRRCEGRSQADDQVMIIRRVPVPRSLGPARVGYRMSYAGYPSSREFIVLVREGRRILLSQMNGDTLDTDRRVSWEFKRRKAIAAMRLLQR